MQLTPGKLWGMRRMSDDSGIFKMTAVDQRPPIKDPIAKHYGKAEAPWEDVARFKRMLVDHLQGHSTAMLLDPHFAIPSAFDVLSPTKGLIVTLENSVFTETEGGRRSFNIDDWTVAKIKRMGADAVKVLAWYRPDADPSVCLAQQEYVRRIGEDCVRYDIAFLLELLVYPMTSDRGHSSDYVEMENKKADHVLASVEEFAKPEYRVDLFKLESPVSQDQADGSARTQALFDEMGSFAGRPWVMLSAGAGQHAFRNILDHAFRAGASGFLAGRAIWLDAFRRFPDWKSIDRELAGGAAGYLASIGTLANELAADWRSHPCYGGSGSRFAPNDESFRSRYLSM